MDIGIVGLGKMGGAIAEHLAEKGFSVTGWDADQEALARLEGIGRAVGSAAEVAMAADVILSIITDDHGVRNLFLGPGGFLNGEIAGKIFIEMSTVQPKTAKSLSPVVTEKGGTWIDAPVMGTIPSARTGRLLALAGGTPEAVDSARDVFSAMTREVVHLGEAGRGYAAKLCVNLLMASYLQSIAESLAFGTRSGIPARQLLEIFQQAPVASPWLETKMPFFLGKDGPPSLDIRSIRKDVMAAVASGSDIGVTMPAASAVLSALSASVACGNGEADLARHARFFMENMVQVPRFE